MDIPLEILRLKNGTEPATPAVDATNPVAWGVVTKRVRDGDAAALDTLYHHFFDTVLNEVRRVAGRDESTCLDLTQDTFLKIIRRIKPIDNENQLRAWIRTVARTTTYDWLRKQSRELHRIQQRPEMRPDLERAFDNATSPDQKEHFEQVAETLARLVLLQEILESLPGELQEIISLRYRWGWTLARIGKRIGLKSGAVDGRIRRAMNKIRLQIEKGNHD